MKYPAIVPVPHTGKEHITDKKGNPVSSLISGVGHTLTSWEIQNGAFWQNIWWLAP